MNQLRGDVVVVPLVQESEYRHDDDNHRTPGRKVDFSERFPFEPLKRIEQENAKVVRAIHVPGIGEQHKPGHGFRRFP